MGVDAPPSIKLCPYFIELKKNKLNSTVLENNKEKSGNSNSYPKVKVLLFPRFNLMISVSTKMLYQEIREISLGSGKSQLNLNKFF